MQKRTFNRRTSTGNMFEVIPDLPTGKAGRYGQAVETITLSALDADDAIRRAVVSGFIPSNTVMQYYKAVPVKG